MIQVSETNITVMKNHIEWFSFAQFDEAQTQEQTHI